MFFIKQPPTSSAIVLDEDTSRHIVQVLRKKQGDAVDLTDGKGKTYSTIISAADKKHCEVTISSENYQPPNQRNVSVAVSLVKNSSRFEWFLEKATEIGINSIIPLICERTEKEKFRFDRLQSILVSAMIQSQQSWLPVLHQPIQYSLLFMQEEVMKTERKFIAHCMDAEKHELRESTASSSAIILIGPEGDFTAHEVQLAIENNFKPVTLGKTRLRTETAALVATTLLVVQ